MARAATITDADNWCPGRFHGRAGTDQYLRWKVTDEGILVLGEDAVRRTRGEPTTLRRVVDDYGSTLAQWAGLFHVDPRTLAAVVAVESGGRPTAEKTEAHLNDRSIGLTQTLTATAYHIYRNVLSRQERALFPSSLGALQPEPDGGDVDSWRAVLMDPSASIGLCAALFRHYNGRLSLRSDPVLLYLTWNAGGVYESSDNPWGLRNYDPDKMGPRPGALDWFTRWYGDACAVYGVCA